MEKEITRKFIAVYSSVEEAAQCILHGNPPPEMLEIIHTRITQDEPTVDDVKKILLTVIES
jgi:hypothetical protein